MDLIAVWKSNKDEYYDAPDFIRWANGGKATLADYMKHIGDSHFWVEKGIFGREMHLCPDVVAIVTHDPYGGVWAVKGDGVESMGLDLHDPNASDDRIYAALNTGKWTYRMIVHRN